MIEQRKNGYYRVSGSKETFTVDIDRAQRGIGRYCDELLLNAVEIYDKKETKNIYCMYSGGIDSELVMEVFLHLGITIIPVIVELDPNFNNHDLSWAKAFCNKHNIEPLIFKINIQQFIESGEILNLAKLTETYAYQYLSSIKAALSLDGTVITGQDEPTIQLDADTGNWVFSERERWCAWAKLYDRGVLKGTSCFLSWSAETLLSFLLEPSVKQAYNNKLPNVTNTFPLRRYVYGYMFPMKIRPKYTGWENVDNHPLLLHPTMKEVANLQNTFNGKFDIECKRLIQQMTFN